MAKTLCCTCGKVTNYTLHSRVASREIDGKEIIFHEKYATCNKCGSEVTIARLVYENARELVSVCNGLKECGLV